MREFNVQEDFSVSVAQFFDLVFLSPKFKLDFHIKRGDTEISVGDWKELGTNKCERAIKFCSPVSDQAILKKLTGGMSPVVHEKQDYELIDNRELRVLSQATSSAGGFNCATTANYIITELPPRPSPSPSSSPVASPACHVDIVVKSEFKSRLFKGQVENMMNQMATQTFEQWIALVKEKVADFHKEERAKNKLPTIQPHSQSPQPLPEFLTDTLSGTVSEYDDTDDDSYYDAQDQLFTSPPSSRTSTPPPHDIRHIGSNSSSHSNSTSNVAFSMPPTGGLTAVIHSLQKEIQNLRSMTEVNASRLLGLETSNYPASPLPPHLNNTNNSNNNNKNIPSPGNEGLLPYLQRLEILAKQQEEETARNREREQEWKSKCSELEAKIEATQSNNGNGKKIVVGWWGVVFILVWPVVAHKLWKYANLLRPVVVRAFWQMLGK